MKKSHLVNWRTMCTEKKKGGLGMRSLSKLNKALLSSGVGDLLMRGIFFRGWSLAVNLAWILGAGARVTLGVAMTPAYGKRLEKNSRPSFRMQLSL